jgi:hypothetical protein
LRSETGNIAAITRTWGLAFISLNISLEDEGKSLAELIFAKSHLPLLQLLQEFCSDGSCSDG